MTTTTNLGLTQLEASQKDKVATINGNNLLLDALLPKPAVTSATDPASMSTPGGTMYFNSVLKITKVFIDGAWQQMGPPYLGDLSADPATTYPSGTRYYNTTSSVFKTLRGSTWVNG